MSFDSAIDVFFDEHLLSTSTGMKQKPDIQLLRTLSLVCKSWDRRLRESSSRKLDVVVVIDNKNLEAAAPFFAWLQRHSGLVGSMKIKKESHHWDHHMAIDQWLATDLELAGLKQLQLQGFGTNICGTWTMRALSAFTTLTCLRLTLIPKDDILAVPSLLQRLSGLQALAINSFDEDALCSCMPAIQQLTALTALTLIGADEGQLVGAADSAMSLVQLSHLQRLVVGSPDMSGLPVHLKHLSILYYEVAINFQHITAVTGLQSLTIEGVYQTAEELLCLHQLPNLQQQLSLMCMVYPQAASAWPQLSMLCDLEFRAGCDAVDPDPLSPEEIEENLLHVTQVHSLTSFRLVQRVYLES